MLLLLELLTILVFKACRVSNCSFFPCLLSEWEWTPIKITL